MDTYYLYLMVDPITDMVRYVGQSKNPKTRKNAHLYSGLWRKTKKNLWLSGLKDQGLKPKFIILCSLYCTKDVVDYYEYRLIKRFESKYLLNERPFNREKRAEPKRLITSTFY